MIKKNNMRKLYKRQATDVTINTFRLNVLLCIISITLILYEAIKYKNINLYLSIGLIICIILSQRILYTLKKNHNSVVVEDANSGAKKGGMGKAKLELHNCNDPMTGLYNSVYLEHILDKLNNEKVTPTTIAVLYVRGLSCLTEKEEQEKVICKVAELVLKNKFKDNIGCISNGNIIVLFLINWNKNNSSEIIDRICKDFNKLYGDSNLRIVYGLEEMSSQNEDIYDIYGGILNNINLSIFK